MGPGVPSDEHLREIRLDESGRDLGTDLERFWSDRRSDRRDQV